MAIETIGDVVRWAQGYHDRLAAQLESSSATTLDNERIQLLLSYLSAHEQKLSDLLDLMEETGDIKALNTWCYDFLDASPIKPHPAAEESWSGLDADEVMKRIGHEHAQLIALYRHLRDQVDRVAAQELLDQLIALEEHDAMQVAQGVNRLHDY